MKFFYGVKGNYVDVTSKVMQNWHSGERLRIPAGDSTRAALFTDHILGTLKHILYVDNENTEHIIDANRGVIIDETGGIIVFNNSRDYYQSIGKYIPDYIEKLRGLHSYIKMEHGVMTDELPEQLMTVMYLNENAKVLELGANIGRNTFIIASILSDDRYLVTLESHPDIVKQLIHNTNLNGFRFHIENAALSVAPLIQKEWNTVVSAEVPAGWVKVNTITFEEIEKKYNIQFDSMVIDAEGAFYQILVDNPDCLKNIHTIIIENDFHEIDKKRYVDNVLNKYGLKSIFRQPGGWGCCADMFFEVFRRV